MPSLSLFSSLRNTWPCLCAWPFCMRARAWSVRGFAAVCPEWHTVGAHELLLNHGEKAASLCLFPQYVADGLIRMCHPGASSPPARTLAFGRGGGLQGCCWSRHPSRTPPAELCTHSIWRDLSPQPQGLLLPGRGRWPDGQRTPGPAETKAPGH